MFLKSLELRGFKSFADKTELELRNGVTVIVGPNGSGKSNILDAVKWVLGEQSIKSLRGGKMQDVIFAGTEFRRPVGMAEVALELDNNDNKLPVEYTDVTIMRRLFRSGESEYYINNNKCRLKDIEELFMDTGIGKEGYSIIGQGKIEAILSGRPEERRGVIEEAAGIVKFKARKEEAEKRLGNTEQNLQRINDIFSTYEERLEPLRRDSEKAKSFLEISNKLKAKEVTLLLHNIDNINVKINSLKDDLNSKELKLKEILIEKDKYKKSLEALNEKLEKFELEGSDKRKKYYENKTEVQRLSSEIDLLNERLNNLITSVNKSSSSLNQYEEKLVKSKELRLNQELENKELLDTQKTLGDDILNYESSIKEKNSSIEESTNLIKQLGSYEKELVREIAEGKNELIILKNDIATLENKLEELKASKEAYVNSTKINNTTKDGLKNEIIKLDEKIEKYNKQILYYKKEMTFENRVLAGYENKYKEISINRDKAEAKCNALVNLEKQHEGYNKSVRTLMQHIDQGKIKGAEKNVYILGEIIELDKQFEKAIEIALGASISNVISKDEVISKKLITYLKTNNLGRATFLPLNIIKGKKVRVSPEVESLHGYVGIASELVKFDKKHVNAIEYTLGKTIISKDMDGALDIAKKSNYSFKIVTLDGEVISPGGALTGGSFYSKPSNIIGRKREIEELKEELVNYNNKIKTLNESITNSKSKIAALDNDCLYLKDKIHYENIEKTKLSGKISALDSETEKIQKNLKITTNEIFIIKENLNKNTNVVSDKEEKINKLSELERENTQKIKSLESSLEDVKKEIYNKNNKITSLRIKKAQVDENILNKDKELKRLEKNIKELESQMISTKKEIDESKIHILSSRNSIEENSKEIKIINSVIYKFEENFKEFDIERIKIKDNIKNISEDLNNVISSRESIEKLKNNIQVSLARQETERDSLYSKLNIEMQLTYAEAEEISIKGENIDQCRKDIAAYKNKISQLGTVNLASIEEYENLLEKYNFMNAQKEDLIKSKEELLKVVEEMTDKMKIVFHENFNILRKNFNETFIELFNGGKADLILGEGDELMANIEINVQPPGKKLQNINLMSGGEKGLSAIALLFAILKMKPTPFCILDEIEAALDDSNVARYADFLRKFSNNTQFIIITHRKGSMEVGDILYGVTMEEKGISKIVSLELNK